MFQRIFQRRSLRLLALSPTVLISQCAPQCAPAPTPTVTVTHVVDGDTVDISTGERVRIIGIDAPEMDTPCGPLARDRMVALVEGAAVDLPTGAREDVDRYGRFLRFVDGPHGDAGRALIADGLAAARYDGLDGYGTHPRQDDYRALDAATEDCAPSTAPTPTPTPTPTPAPAPRPPSTQPPTSNCHPAYVECLPNGPDLDCAQIGHLVHLRSIGNDPYRLDGSDNDGLGCEAYA